MATKISNFSTLNVDEQSVTGLAFLPQKIHFWVVDKPTMTETAARTSTGAADGIKQFCVSTYADGVIFTGKGYFDRCINIKNRVNNTATDVVIGKLTSIDDYGNGVYGFTIHYDAKSPGYRIYFEAEG